LLQKKYRRPSISVVMAFSSSTTIPQIGSG